jgi:hypothetical protein
MNDPALMVDPDIDDDDKELYRALAWPETRLYTPPHILMDSWWSLEFLVDSWWIPGKFLVNSW